MNKVLAIVLLIFALMGTEVTMAKGLSGSGAVRTNTARPQQVAQDLPAWLQGGDKGNDTLRNAPLAGNKNNNVLAPRPNQKNEDEMNQQNQPAWLQAVQDAWNVASPLLAGPAGIPSSVSQLVNLVAPPIADMLPAGKRNDTLAPGSPNKNKDKLSRLSGRTMFGEGVGPGTLDPSLWNQQAGGGFGSSYGGNWRGGGGGYGGGGGGYNYADNNYPAWLKSLMGLYSWNIK